jgi:hypothetical protein
MTGLPAGQILGEDGSMTGNVTLWYFAGCPSWETAFQRVHEAATLAGLDVRVATQSVESTENAVALGFIGSPTIWLDGTDPFAQPGQGSALACRVYATPDGLAGSPTVGQLVDVLRRLRH